MERASFYVKTKPIKLEKVGNFFENCIDFHIVKNDTIIYFSRFYISCVYSSRRNKKSIGDRKISTDIIVNVGQKKCMVWVS